MNIPNNSSITVAGKRVPVVFQDGNGRAIVPGSVERDIVLSFIGSALASPVTGLIVVIGSGYREIKLAVEGIVQGTKIEVEGIVQATNTEISGIKRKGQLDRMNNVFHLFGSEITNLEYANYPDEVKNMYKEILSRKMKVELEKL